MYMKLKDINTSTFLLDLRPINTATVSRYRQAMRQGAKFPPIKVDLDHNILVAGNHRFTAMLEEYGEDLVVEVVPLHCSNWREVLQEFTLDNKTHGMPLKGFSRRRTALALMSLGEKPEDIASLFDVSTGRIENWGDETVRVIGQSGHESLQPLKRGAPSDSDPISEAEYRRHVSIDKSVTVRNMADQIVSYANRGWLRLNDDRELEKLEELRNTLNRVLGRQ